MTQTPDDSEFIWSVGMERKKPLFIARIWGKHIKEHECFEKKYISTISKARTILPPVDLCFSKGLISPPH